MQKKGRIIIWTITTIAVTAGICYLFSLFPKYFSFDSFIFAFELNFLLMGWVAFTTPLLKMNYEWTYFLPKNFENDGKIYNYFGVNIYRKILVIVGWEKITKSINMAVKNNIENIKSREKNTRAGEFSHLLIAIIVLIITLILTKSIKDAKWLLLTNLIFHIYPIFIQRYNRPRYLRVIDTLEKRNNLN